MDWRLQGAGLLVSAVLASIPFAFGPVLSPRPFVMSWQGAAFRTSWNAVVSSMHYLFIIGLVFAILGVAWRGPIGQRSARMQVYASLVITIWIIWNIYYVGWIQLVLDENCCRLLIPWVEPAQNHLVIGLLIPAVTFASSLFWLVRDHRRNPTPTPILITGNVQFLSL